MLGTKGRGGGVFLRKNMKKQNPDRALHPQARNTTSRKLFIPQNLVHLRHLSPCPRTRVLVQERQCESPGRAASQDVAPPAEPCRFDAVLEDQGCCLSVRFGESSQKLCRLFRPSPPDFSSKHHQVCPSSFP